MTTLLECYYSEQGEHPTLYNQLALKGELRIWHDHISVTILLLTLFQQCSLKEKTLVFFLII